MSAFQRKYHVREPCVSLPLSLLPPWPQRHIPALRQGRRRPSRLIPTILSSLMPTHQGWSAFLSGQPVWTLKRRRVVQLLRLSLCAVFAQKSRTASMGISWLHRFLLLRATRVALFAETTSADSSHSYQVKSVDASTVGSVPDVVSASSF